MLYLFKNEVVDYEFVNNKSETTILFLHGWGGNKFSFVKTINIFKNKFNILSLTIPTTSPTTNVWTLFDYLELVENLLSLHSIKNLIIICHSFGFRISLLLNKKVAIKKIVVTGGAGIKKKFNLFEKIALKNNKVLLKNEKFKHLFKFIASKDYVNLSSTNKETFKNIVNLNLSFLSKFNCPMLLFWGLKDNAIKPWIAKQLKKQNNATLILTKSDHFAYINQNARFNHEIIKFIKND